MATLVIVLVTFLVVFGDRVQSVAAVAKESYEKLEAFTNILAIVQKNYVDPVTAQQLVEGAINGMLTSLDPHSAYLTPDLYKELQVDTKGSFGGLGIEISVKNGILTVVSPIEDTPAFKAGIKPGDQIIKINGEFTKDMSLIEAVKKMRGPRGTKIILTIRRDPSPELLDIQVTREIIRIDSVKAKPIEKGYAYVRITQFQERTDEDLEKAIDGAEKRNGGHIDGLILDLRNNPGGLLTQAVRVSDMFLDSGLIVYTEGRLEGQKQRYYAHKRKSHLEFPIVVLVNSGSASAAEIVAGALQDHRRALVLGTQTFGKGSVQTILPLEDNSALRLTTARYYTPSGRSIQATGITPDIIMEEQLRLAKAEGAQPGGTEAIREENLPRHFGNGRKPETSAPAETAPGDGVVPPQSKEEEPPVDSSVQAGEVPPEEDPHVKRALELLKGWQVFRTVMAEKPVTTPPVAKAEAKPKAPDAKSAN